MRNLIEFLQRYLYWLVFLVLEVISLLSLVRYNSYQGSVVFTTANEVVGTAYRMGSNVVAYFHLGEENAALETENELLRKQLHDLQQQMRQMNVVPDSLPVNEEQSESDYRFVQAQVCSMTLHKANNLMTIDKGERDGVRPEMGVVSSNGVVGIVYLTSQHYSIVIPLLNQHSQTSCRLRGSEYFGTMQWERGDADYSYVNGIPRHAQVKKGDWIETNGFSDIFPEGIPVGKVVKIGDSVDGMAYRLTVKLSVDFKTLRNVSVITNYSKPERRLLEQKADSLMMVSEE
ncbi:MAG: rod shape-determining protein MreC [Bacteroidaceae bacterium]|nr:rod shape-determining protein MreC [Bacteroidaceae bacterium]